MFEYNNIDFELNNLLESLIQEHVSKALNEATIVNKFKKSMTLYNAGNGPAEMLYPKYPSAGNRLEKQSGEAVFFFSTMEEAKLYAIAKGIIEHFKGFINYTMKEIKTIENDQVRNAIYNYIDLQMLKWLKLKLFMVIGMLI